MAAARSAPVRIDLSPTLKLLRTHITQTLCDTVFTAVRTTERQREWTLHALVQFWVAVIVRAPRALTQALEGLPAGTDPLFPAVGATPEAFFQRCRDLRPAFFAAVFAQFTARLLVRPPRYAAPWARLQARFAAVCVLDGSPLPAIAHRLKLLWAERAVLLPGCLLAVYDVGRGLCRVLAFDPDAAAAELRRAQAALAALPRSVLLISDRLYGTAAWFAALTAAGCWGLVRRHKSLSLRAVGRRRSRRYAGGRLTECRVEAGAGRPVPVQLLRYIRWRRGGTVVELLTNVLDPQRLSAAEAVALYRERWTIERMFRDLKVVLNLNRVYAANPNAIAMQVFAAGCVYNALRVAQAEVAGAAGVAPEAIAPAKFFPKVAAACYVEALFELWFVQTRRANPGRRLRRAARLHRRFASVPLATILVEPRKGRRRKRRFCPARARWKSFAHVRGGRNLLKN